MLEEKHEKKPNEMKNLWSSNSLTASGLGTGLDCINLIDAGWESYDSERI